MLKLEDIIDAKEGREIKRAAAKMVLEGFVPMLFVNYQKFQLLLSVNGKMFMAEGAEGLLLNHSGKSFLTSQRNEVIAI